MSKKNKITKKKFIKTIIRKSIFFIIGMILGIIIFNLFLK